jgi:hypothetical protein
MPDSAKRNRPEPQTADAALLVTGENSGNRRRALLIIILLGCIGFTYLLNAADLECPNGESITADLGDGVTLRTCMWEKEPNVRVRSGPLELVKNGTLILRTQTDVNGKLQGRFTAWSDEGEIIQNGLYNNGLKEGVWLETDKNGASETLRYLKGVPVKP